MRSPSSALFFLPWLLLAASALGCGAGAAQPESPPAAQPEAAAPSSPPADGPPAATDEPSTDGKEPVDKAVLAPAKPAEGGDKSAVENATVNTPLGGTLSRDDIQAIVEKHGDYFNDCYTLGAGKSQQFVANVTLKVTLGPSGSVSDAKVTKSTAKNPRVDQCVIDGFKKIKFPAPKSGATSVFTFPMDFKGAVEVR